MVRTCEPPWVATLGHANEAFSGQNTFGASGGDLWQKVTDLNVVTIKEKVSCDPGQSAAFPAELPKVAPFGSVGDATVEDARQDSDEKPSYESSGIPIINACREDLTTDDSEHCMRILDFSALKRHHHFGDAQRKKLQTKTFAWDCHRSGTSIADLLRDLPGRHAGQPVLCLPTKWRKNLAHHSANL